MIFWINISLEFVPKGQIFWSQQNPSIGPDNGLALTRWQAIVWTNDINLTDAYMRYSAWMS